MHFNKRCLYYVFLFLVYQVSISVSEEVTSGATVLKRVYDNCEKSENLLKCLKIQALKFTDRALNADAINLIDGVSMVRDDSYEQSRAFHKPLTPLGAEGQLSHMKSTQIDNLLAERVQSFIESRKLEFSLPKFLAAAADTIGEGRGHKNKKNSYVAPLIAAVTLKGGLLAMAFKAVALLAGKALLVGKIALVLSAILGLKKLLSHEGHEKTTYEIVKHPHVSHSQSYSSSHYGAGNEYDAGGVGHYHRSMDAVEDGHDYSGQDKAYKAYLPKKYQ